MTTPLLGRIAKEIEARGPISIERYWQIALFDRRHGYYSSREPFGRGGDFVTAPEVSQMFGELLGAWVAAAWEGLGAPNPFLLAELGPGRGTLMADMLRTLRKSAPHCLAASRIRLVETSERLAALQAVKLEGFDLPIKRVRQVDELEALPTIVVANELFDAIAIRQFVHQQGKWHERRIGLNGEGALEFVIIQLEADEAEAIAGIAANPAEPLPHSEEGAILEVSPAREALASTLAERLATHGGSGLFIDYGHGMTGFGDTFQAMSEHRYVSVLDGPGEADLTSHVDFARLAACFADKGLSVAPLVGQGPFLLSLGLLERAGRLGAPLGEAGREAIRADVQRLAGNGPKDMGDLFKVLAVASAPLPLSPFTLLHGDGFAN
ncbi:MAG: SAM-dependent methyltransferase [Fulvimarina manganoxydans]|uniref:class I SAM-dependent methyltransferase n=1 Tax=Fulvimarina manganoxydans TaxID=937218 RepID=UPI0023576A29|nr:SAM-dependent methyltransferase [Fulvimarina manganoxydans]MCK5934434.1 SAM-dependent methyltransferase [Fulvimarina manganoxydans]